MSSRDPYGFAEPPVLYVKAPVLRKLQTFVQLCPIEINGFGTIERLGHAGFFLKDVFIFEQTAGPAHVDISEEVMHRQLFEMQQAGIEVGSVRFQWHSHVDMAAYMSSTDVDNINRYPGDWMISMVTNKRGEYEMRLDTMRPFRITVPVGLRVEIDPDDATTDECRAAIQDKVKGLPRTGSFLTRNRSPQIDPVTAVAVQNVIPSPAMQGLV